MTTQIRISAKTLGELAMPDFCPRCFWIKLRLNNKLPFQIFPGIFSSIDAYTKNIIHNFINSHGKFPSWLDGLGDLTGYKQPPHYSKFNILDREYNILLTGAPDGIFVRADKSNVIVDYKTAKYTATQDSLLPMYKIQLNGYAMIGEHCGLSPVSGLALIYMEPITNTEAVVNQINQRNDGFAMGFAAHIQNVELDQGSVLPLLARVREIYEMSSIPTGCLGCDDCQIMEKLSQLYKIA
jgi:hypothetical protein